MNIYHSLAKALCVLLLFAGDAFAADKAVTKKSVSRAKQQKVLVATLPNNKKITTKKTITELQRNYARAKVRYRIPRHNFKMRKPPRSSAPTPLEEYLALVGPTNECTILVRKVCGSEKQCDTSPGCPVALQLLERYNSASGSEQEDNAQSCLISLEDGVLFNECIS